MIARAHPRPQFRIGQLVKHRRYHYRGVIVDYDDFCQAPEQWYQSNRTRPDRNQPWYHVLVHDSDTITYAAQTSLQADNSEEPIEHPLVEVFFSEFTGDCYVRNERPFGDW